MGDSGFCCCVSFDTWDLCRALFIPFARGLATFRLTAQIPVYFSVNALVQCISYSASTLSLLLISFNRYLHVCHRSAFRAVFNAKRNRLICLAIWIVSALLNAPLLSGFPDNYGYDPDCHICNSRAGRKEEPGYEHVVMVIFLLVTVLMIGYFNTAIFIRWRRSRRKFRKRSMRRNGPKATWRSFVSMSLVNQASEDGSGGTRREGVTRETALNRHHKWSGEWLGSSRPRLTASSCDAKNRGDAERDVVGLIDARRMSRYRACSALMLCDAGPVVTKETEVDSKADVSVSTEGTESVSSKAGEPASSEVEGCVSSKVVEPVNREVEGGVSSKADEPVNREVEGGVSSKVSEPVNREVEGGVSSKVGEPVNREVEGGVSSKAGEPVSSEVVGGVSSKAEVCVNCKGKGSVSKGGARQPESFALPGPSDDLEPPVREKPAIAKPTAGDTARRHADTEQWLDKVRHGPTKSFRKVSRSPLSPILLRLLATTSSDGASEVSIPDTTDSKVVESLSISDDGFLSSQVEVCVNCKEKGSVFTTKAYRPKSLNVPRSSDDLKLKVRKKRAVATVTVANTARRYADTEQQLDKPGITKSSRKNSRSPLSPILLRLLATSSFGAAQEDSSVRESDDSRQYDDEPSSTDSVFVSSESDSEDRDAGDGGSCTADRDRGTEDESGRTSDITPSPSFVLEGTGAHLRTFRRSRKASRKRTANDVALVRSLLVISIGLFLFYVPFVVTLLLTFLLGCSVPPALSATSMLLLLMNCCVNWVIYGIMNTAFRKNFADTLRRLSGSCRQMRRAQSSSRFSSLRTVTRDRHSVDAPCME